MELFSIRIRRTFQLVSTNKKLSSCLFVRFLPAPGAVPDTAHDKVRFLNHHEALAVRQAENRDVAGMELRI